MYENKSCLEIKFVWAPAYLKQLLGCVSERQNQERFEYKKKDMAFQLLILCE